MKKVMFVLSLCAILLTVSACKAKRCECKTFRGNEVIPAYCYEPLNGHRNCSELDMEWTASDSTQDILKKTCVPEE